MPRLTFYGSRDRDPHDAHVHDRNEWLRMWAMLSGALWRAVGYLPGDIRTHVLEPPRGLRLIGIDT